MTLILDPSLKVVDKDHQIFILHPGDGKRFYNDFRATSMIFLDIPGAALGSAPDIDDEETRQRLRMSRAIGGWHKGGRPATKIPSRKLEDYQVSVEGRDAPRYMREVKTLYVDAKPGDLVIIPGPGYTSEVLFAEIIEDFDPEVFAEASRYQFEKVPARRVKFIRTSHAKYEFGRRAIKLMQNRQAIIRVHDDADRHEFYEHAYGDYVWGNASGSYMEVTKAVIDQKDLTDVLFLTNYFGAMYVALKAGELDRFIHLSETKGLHKGLNEYYNRELFGDISIEVHSPGFFGRPMRDPAIAGFVAAMTVLATMQVAPTTAAQIQVENSANSRQSVCDMTLETDIRSTMQIVTNSHLWWDELCGMQKVAAEQVGLKTKSKIIDKP